MHDNEVRDLAGQIVAEEVAGLRPETWICVGPGFVREDIKAVLLESGRAFTSEPVFRLQDLALRIVDPSLQMLSGPARQEALRSLLADSRISRRLPELRRLKRQRNFFRKLDRAFQSGRVAFSSAEEEQVFSERLEARTGVANPIRKELGVLRSAYEALLQAWGTRDLPMILREACDVLDAGNGLPFRLPRRIQYFSAQSQESLEASFWERLGRLVQIEQPRAQAAATKFMMKRASLAESLMKWERWHTLDDAAEALAERLAEDARSVKEGDPWADTAVLIPDEAHVRRSLIRAFQSHQIPLADPRDPTRLRWDEGLKWALLPLQVIARNFERALVVSWLESYLRQTETPNWILEINSRGIRDGIASYQGGILAPVHSHLHEMSSLLGGRKTARELLDAHLTYLRSQLGSESALTGLSWVIPFFEDAWEELALDLARVGMAERRAPTLYWIERMSVRLEEATPPADPVRPLYGVRLYRLTQAPLSFSPKVHVFGLPADWLSGEGVGDYWYSAREREFLGSEFAVRSSISVGQERKDILAQWLGGAAQVTFLDAQYGWDGGERESIAVALSELGYGSLGDELQAEERGSHPRFATSFGAIRETPPQRVELEALSVRGVREIRATELDHFTRCGFRGLAAGRWKLWDIREPGSDLWPDTRGNILHTAIRLLHENPALAPSESIEQAWLAERPKGLLKGERLAKYVKGRLLAVLETFLEKDLEYRTRSGAEVLHVEGPSLRLEFPDFAVVGRPDRVDGHKDGIFILDFKTSAALPSGRDIVDLGYRLQLPFYAVAARKALNRDALGVQFVELSRKGGRTRGIFFSRWNGKESGKLTHTRAKLSLFDGEPAELWSQLEDSIRDQGAGYLSGVHEARPKKESSECPSCPFGDLCGKRRVSAQAEVIS